jgi:LPXTG-motif cell wall-anchored protein
MELPEWLDDPETRLLLLGGVGAVSVVFGLETGQPIAIALGGLALGLTAGLALRRRRA